jgi:hypothetical protein
VFTAEIAQAIVERLEAGETLRAVCRDAGMPDERTVRRWALNDVEGFGVTYSRAREVGAYAMADGLLEIVDDGSNDWMEGKDGEIPGWRLNGEHVQRSRLRADTRKWLLSKILPSVFGDRQHLQQLDSDGKPINPSIAHTILVIEKG